MFPKHFPCACLGRADTSQERLGGGFECQGQGVIDRVVTTE